MDQKVKRRLHMFAEYFVKEFEIKLRLYLMVLEGEVKKAGNLASTFSSFAASGGGLIGTLLGRSDITGRIGSGVGGIVGEALQYIGGNNYMKKACSLAELVYSFHENEAFYRELLVRASIDLFQSFEMQFMRVSTDQGYQSALRKLAEDAVSRALDHFTIVDTADLTKAVLTGHSKLYSILDRAPLPRKVKTPGYSIKYQHNGSEKEWWTSSLYEKVGIVISDQTLNYYEKKRKGSETYKYGYRRLLPSESWDDHKNEYEASDTSKSLEFTEYQYTLKSQDLEQLSRDILSDINSKDKSLGEDRIKAAVEEVREDFLKAVTILKEQNLQIEQNSQVLERLENSLKSLRINQYLERFSRGLEEVNAGIRQNQQVTEIGFHAARLDRGEKAAGNTRLHEKTHMELAELRNTVREAVTRPTGSKKDSMKSVWFNVKSPVSSFLGREKELNDLRATLQGVSDSEEPPPFTVICGLGGVGKSELVKKFVSLYSEDYDSNVLWISAESSSAITMYFRALAKDCLGIRTKNSDGEERHIKCIVNEVYRFFSGRKTLFIFDDVENCQDDFIINDFLPSLPKGLNKIHVLVTSRNQTWSERVKLFPLDVFTENEALKFVKTALGLNDDAEDEDIIKLIKTVQYFPLTLQEAVASIRVKNDELRNIGLEYKIRHFLQEYEKKETERLGFIFPDETTYHYGRRCSKTTLITWEVTLNQICKRQNGPKTIEILQTMAFLSPNDIPADIFKNLECNTDELGSAISLLKQYSMVSEGEKPNILGIHKLVQQVIRIKLREENKEKEFIDKVFSLLRGTTGDRPTQRTLLPHFKIFLSHLDDWIVRAAAKRENIDEIYFSRYLFIAKLPNEVGDPKSSVHLLKRALSRIREHCSKDNWLVPEALGLIGVMYEALGNPKKQKDYCEEALDILQKHTGGNNLKVATALVNLSNAFGALGDPHTQKELLERALIIEQEHRESDKIEIARTLLKLANVHGNLGDPSEKRDLLEKALAIEEQHYGTYDINVASTLVNLARVYGVLDKPCKKRDLLERALVIERRHYGRDNLEVAKILVHLSHAYGDLNEPSKRRDLLEQALFLQREDYGRDNFETARTLLYLGKAYGALGNKKKKKELLEQARDINQEHYGSENFKTVRTLVSLGDAYGELGDLSKKKDQLEKALKIYQEHYGSENFKVVKTMVSLGTTYGQLGDQRKKKDLLEWAILCVGIALNDAKKSVNLQRCKRYARLNSGANAGTHA